MPNLIVDFPKQRRKSSVGGERAKVQFGDTIEVAFFERFDKNDFSNIWYEDKDYRRMKFDIKQSVQRIRESICNSEDPSQEVGECMIAGLEHLCTESIEMTVRDRRFLCQHAVLEEQAKQASMDDAWEKLRIVSIEISKPAVERAHTIGSISTMDEWNTKFQYWYNTVGFK